MQIQHPPTADAKCGFSNWDLNLIKITCKGVNKGFEQGQPSLKDELCLSQAMIH